MADDQAIVAVDIKLGKTVDVGTPRQLLLFRTPITRITGRGSWLPAPDGQRFLILAVTDDEAKAPATVVVNWPATTRAQ